MNNPKIECCGIDDGEGEDLVDKDIQPAEPISNGLLLGWHRMHDVRLNVIRTDAMDRLALAIGRFTTDGGTSNHDH